MIFDWQLELNDLVFISIIITGIYLCRFWLVKIYNRVRQIAKIMEHSLRKEKNRGKKKGKNKYGLKKIKSK